MDKEAINYNPEATLNDKDLCEYSGGETLGCTDSMAENYNPEATSDDGSCIYSSDPCEGVDCNGNGTCVGGVCSCNPGYSGNNCEVEDLCYGVTCIDPNSACSSGSGICECITGYHDEGGACVAD
jgi:hypothetical protein